METHTIVGVFDDEARARGAVERLVEWGYTRDNVHLTGSEAAMAAGRDTASAKPSSVSLPDSDAPHGHARSVFHRLFGDTARDEDVSYFCEAVRRGSVVVTVTSGSDEGADSAADILNEFGAVDIEVHARYLREAGWQGSRGPSTTPEAAGAGGVGQEPVAGREASEDNGRRDRRGVRIYTRSAKPPAR